MADNWQTYPVEFRGGLVTNLSPIQQGINLPGSARQLRNFEPSVEGGYRRILGYTKYDTNIVTGTGLIRGVVYYNNKVLAVRSNTGGGEGELYESAGGGWTRKSTDSIRFSSGSNKIRFRKYNFTGSEKVIMVDGVGKPIIYDGTSVTQLTALSSDYAGGNHLEVYKDHIFMATDYSVFFSAPFADTDWSAASGGGVITFNDFITGIKVFRDQLYVFTKRQVHRIVGNTVSDFQRIPVSLDLGCIEEDTIQEIAGDIVFMGPDGLRLLSGTERIGDVGLGAITKPIQSEATSFQTRNNTFTSLVIRNKTQYRIFGYKSGDPVSQSQGLIGVQFASQGGDNMAWSETRGIKAYVSYSEYAESQEVLLFANNDGYVYELESGISFDGENIPASFFTPYLPINDPTIRKTLYAVHTYIDPDGSFNADMSLNYDFNGQDVVQPEPITLTNTLDTEVDGLAVGTYGLATYATYSGETLLSGFIYGDAVRVTLRKQVTGSGFVVSLEYVSDGSTQPFTLDALAIEFATNSRR